ncbi:hypothetical protein B602_0517 [Chlamydia psittaci M56]|nr:hypothetical protein G5O_0510 [Chlamydia psittaci 6BC]AFS25031.1 hypothetical protein B602_0517 [Chlamydia psittaci M56]EPJ16728.1 hypothetical protein CP02DC22_0933 [Chlamydia psittaci 02DC22]EPJ29436.1 hypothetical protein CPC1998_0204 [Chlamydia psittaci C19/98]EPJ33029.1 hypothetical protein CP061683_0757 [Chlamydia psittaci 06-1683]EPJ97932.1 hypothetical protein CP02DC14_0940 [Chlamydia psittaci 02DC14]EPL00371.1 hypothetical protein CP02DC24_0203 [Chlamydia psittaci 02DC24]EPP33466
MNTHNYGISDFYPQSIFLLLIPILIFYRDSFHTPFASRYLPSKFFLFF